MIESKAAHKRRMRAAGTLVQAAQVLRLYNEPALAAQVDKVADHIATDKHAGRPVT